MYVRQAWARVQQERGEDPKLPLRGNDELGENDWEKRLLRYVVDSPALSRPIPRALRPLRRKGIDTL